ncbi:hypothetical protein L0F63_000788 [Massospora cicadina]|nr:hypothetical protein L0F63_000788 [Massospora cicadina]
MRIGGKPLVGVKNAEPPNKAKPYPGHGELYRFSTVADLRPQPVTWLGATTQPDPAYGAGVVPAGPNFWMRGFGYPRRDSGSVRRRPRWVGGGHEVGLTSEQPRLGGYRWRVQNPASFQLDGAPKLRIGKGAFREGDGVNSKGMAGGAWDWTCRGEPWEAGELD